MKEIDFIIAVRDRDSDRIQRCIDSLKDYAKKVIVVDYGSKKPINIKDAEIIRYTKSKPWNKSHALNLGIKKSTSEYICTVDGDFILNDVLLDELEKNLGEYVAIFNTNVRRIDIDSLSEDYSEMLSKSRPWFENNYSNIYSRANGGIQAMHRSFIERIGGYDEGLGLYWGAMDNRIYEQAKGLGLTILDLNIPMLHQEHEKKKEDNLGKEEREMASYLRAYKITLLKEMINNWDFISPRPWGEEKPNHDWILKELDEFKEKAIPSSRVCISVTTNFEYVPIYFMLDLVSMMGAARRYGVETIIFSTRNSGGVDTIRNTAVEYAKEYGCTHILHLDTDHRYPDNTLVDMLRHKKQMVCGLTNKRVQDFELTQYEDINEFPINKPENVIKYKKGELKKIGATGMAGALIHLSVYDAIKKPYYEFTRREEKGKFYKTGEDVNFCKKLAKAGIDIWCDTNLNFPHQVTNAFAAEKGIILK